MGYKTLFCFSFACLLYIVFLVFFNIASEMNFEICDELKDRFRVFYGIDIESCKYECGRRPDCNHLSYQLSRKECGLYGILNNETEVFGFESSDEIELDLRVNKTCVIIDRSHIDMTKFHHEIGTACQINGTCQYGECPSVPQMDPIRGVVKGNMQNIGAKVKVQCNDEYTRIPDKQTVVCGNDGQWGEVPECLRCPSLPQIDQGFIEGNRRNIGATVEVHCRYGFTRVPDNETVVCGNDGQWGVFPKCLRCPAVPKMNHTRGRIEGNMRTIGATVTVQCKEGYTMVPDNETVVCGNDGQWGVFPKCLWNCSEPCSRLQNTSEVSTGGTLEGDTRNYTCRDGLHVNDTSQSPNITIVCSLRGWIFEDKSSQLCVNNNTYPNYLERVVILRSCMVIEFNGDRKTYEESREQCSRYGDLVRVDTAEKQNILQEYMTTYHHYDYNWYWIQGKREGEEWRFSDGTQIDQLSWAPTQPWTHWNCIAISPYNDWMWRSYCEISLGYICEYIEI